MADTFRESEMEAAQEFAERVGSGEFDDVSKLTDAELSQIIDEASAALITFEGAHMSDERIACMSVHLRANTELRSRQEAPEKRRKQQRERLDALVGFGRAVRAVSEWVKVPYDRESAEPPLHIRDFTSDVARITTDGDLQRVLSDYAPYTVENNRRNLDMIEDCISSLRMLESFDVGSLISDMESCRSYAAEIIRLKESNYASAKAELDKRAARRAERERARENMPETLAQLEQRVRELEGGL